MTANNANSKIRIENCQRFMEHNLSKQELLLAWLPVNWEQRAAQMPTEARIRSAQDASQAQHDGPSVFYFAFPAFGRTTTREVTC
jgi:hypothetical protein